jgi:hypothetical protein
MNFGVRQNEHLPTIHVRLRKSPGVALLVGGLLVVGIGLAGLWGGRFAPALAYGLMGGGGAIALVGLAWLCDRRPRVIINAQGVDVVTRRTGILRWNEIIHVECFTSDQGQIALFVTAEALARIPREATRSGTPVLANDAFAGPPVWFGDGLLEYSAADLAAELIARRRGDAGPITARLHR